MLNTRLSEAGSSLGKTCNEKHPFNFIKTSPLGQLSITDSSFGPKAKKNSCNSHLSLKLVLYVYIMHQQGGDNHLWTQSS